MAGQRSQGPCDCPKRRETPHLAGHGGESSRCCGNTRAVIDRFASAWDQNAGGAAESLGEPDAPLIAIAAEPRERVRTRLADEDVDTARTDREHGVNVSSLVKQFGVLLGTVRARPGKDGASSGCLHAGEILLRASLPVGGHQIRSLPETSGVNRPIELLRPRENWSFLGANVIQHHPFPSLPYPGLARSWR